MIPPIPIKRLPHAEGLPLPAYETAHGAGGFGSTGGR